MHRHVVSRYAIACLLTGAYLGPCWARRRWKYRSCFDADRKCRADSRMILRRQRSSRAYNAHGFHERVESDRFTAKPSPPGSGSRWRRTRMHREGVDLKSVHTLMNSARERLEEGDESSLLITR